MITTLYRGVLAGTALLLLTACEPNQEAMEVQPQTTVPGLDEPANVLLMGADTATSVPAREFKAYDAILQGREGTRGIVKKMANIMIDPPLGQMIAAARKNGGRDAPGLAGIGGIPGHMFLDLASGKVGPGNAYNPVWTVTADERKGQILGYVYRNPATGDGRMVVETWVTWTVTHSQGNAPPKTTTDRFKFDVRVAGGFSAERKMVQGDPNYDPDNVFPGAGLMIDEQMADRFDWKVYALGESIEVEKVWFDHNGNGVFDPNEGFTEQTATGWQRDYLSLFDRSPDNCIDMMVVEHGGNTPPVPMTRDELRTSVVNSGEPLKYCLGRCESPPLVNTK